MNEDTLKYVREEHKQYVNQVIETLGAQGMQVEIIGTAAERADYRGLHLLAYRNGQEFNADVLGGHTVTIDQNRISEQIEQGFQLEKIVSTVFDGTRLTVLVGERKPVDVAQLKAETKVPVRLGQTAQDWPYGHEIDTCPY